MSSREQEGANAGVYSMHVMQLMLIIYEVIVGEIVGGTKIIPRSRARREGQADDAVG